MSNDELIFDFETATLGLGDLLDGEESDILFIVVVAAVAIAVLSTLLPVLLGLVDLGDAVGRFVSSCFFLAFVITFFLVAGLGLRLIGDD